LIFPNYLCDSYASGEVSKWQGINNKQQLESVISVNQLQGAKGVWGVNFGQYTTLS